jgi:hypothetical protein
MLIRVLRGLNSLLKNSARAAQGLKPLQKTKFYRSAESAAPPKIEFFSKL